MIELGSNKWMTCLFDDHDLAIVIFNVMTTLEVYTF